MPNYPTKQAAVDALFGKGTTITGESIHYALGPNPSFNAGLPESTANPRQIANVPDGTVLTVQRADGKPDKITLSNAKDVGGTGKGGIGYEVLEGPQTAATQTASPAGALERLDANLQPVTDPSKPAVYVRDPKAPPGTQPFKLDEAGKLGDPTTWVKIMNPNDPTQVSGFYDPKTQTIAASVTAAPNAKPTGVFDNVIDPNDPNHKRVIGMVDQGDKSLHAVSTQADGKQVITTSTGIYSYDKDSDTTKLLTTIDPHSPLQIVTYPDGSIYSFNPNEPDTTRQLTKLQGEHPPQTITSNGTTYTLKADGTGYELPPGVNRPTTVDNTTALKRIVIRDDQGNVISDTPNVNYQAPAATVPTPNTTAPFIQVQDPNDPSKLIWTKNEGRVTASDALKNLASHLTGQVVSGDITVDEAKALIDAANSKMTNDINQQNADTSKATQVAGAAGEILANTRTNAQTGAGMLESRVTAATSMLNNVLGLAGQGQRSGNMGGGLMSAPAGLGEQLVGGIQGWTADLMGGQATLDSAARLVQMADPRSNLADPATQHAIGVLSLMLDKYQEQTGQLHPAVQATVAANQGAQANGMAAPSPTGQTNVGVGQALAATQSANALAAGVAGQPSTASLNAQGLLDTPQGRAIAQGQTPVANNPPQYPGQFNAAWQQGVISPVGTISTGPNASNGFVAPPAAPPKASPTIVINAA
jgi:hypothetical protein